MLFTLHRDVQLPQLTFDNCPVKYVEDHKHLGLTLSSDGKWHKHIDSLTTSASKVLGIMRKLKFKVSRKTLNQIYISFLRPKIEYASVVWDGCSQYEKDSLDKIQNEAARIVTGLTRSVSLINLHKEIGWLSLSDRRDYQKLVLFYKIHNDMAPDFLKALCPPLTHETTDYNLRRSDDYYVMTRRTEIFSKSLIPSAINLWNRLASDTRNITSLNHFKATLRKSIYFAPKVPKFFLSGHRLYSVIHARIRNKCSDLKSDLFKNHLSDNEMCNCGHEREDAEHYFFRCNNFTNERHQLFLATRNMHPLNSDKILNGIDRLTEEENTLLFHQVQNFIRDTGRFT